MLATFAGQRDITYRLLSDEGSVVIRQLGLYNAHLPEQAAYYDITPRPHHFGVPYPGSFILDDEGIVRERAFEQSFRVRPTAVEFVESTFGAESGQAGVRAQAETGEVRVAAWLGQATYRPYQKLMVHLGIQIGEGLHIYGRPIPEGYVPLSVDVEQLAGMQSGNLELPEPRPYQVIGLDERFVVYEGEIRGRLPVILTQDLGNIGLTLTVRYQACTERECFPPKQLTLRLPLGVLDNLWE